VADFIGRTNFVQATVLGVNGNLVAMEALGQTVTIPKPDKPVNVGQRVRLVVRPEAIAVVDRGGQYVGIVRWASYLGNVVEYQIEVAGQNLAVIDTDPRHTVIHPPGHEVGVQFLDDCIYVLPE
jgi:iron(III) transport system ATP-binding protein